MESLPPGRYERLLDRRLTRALERLELPAEIADLDPAEAPGALVRFLGPHLSRAFTSIGRDRLQNQWRLAGEVLALLESHAGGTVAEGDLLADRAAELRAVARPGAGLGSPEAALPPDPGLPLSLTELLVNGRGERRLGAVLERELASADGADLLCSFLKWSGFRVLREALVELRARGCPLRVLTTAYCGATEPRVLDALAEMGAEVKVSLETRRTRLHAKAWLLHRESGFTTAFVGSSNLSSAALLDGLEWNVRLSAVENPAVVERFAATFDSYWEDQEFRSWSDQLVQERFRQAVAREGGSAAGEEPAEALLGLELRPWPFQEEILERLATARRVRGRHRNLVVAATGTGKTMVAAFDYARLAEQRRREEPGAPRPSLLFVAHRKEILDQSLRTYRAVLRDPTFGERMVEGDRPRRGQHVFASIQSLHRAALDDLDPASFDVLVVDEFHRAEARTYQRLLQHLRPAELLGLTATPERTDGRWVQDTFFDGRITAELRLWDALERGLLCPFQYFGVADGTDLRRLRWSRSGYDARELERVLTGNDIRARLVHQQVQEKVADPARMRALGFCVSVVHAEFMAARFRQFGYRTEAVSGQTGREDRASAIQRLRQGELQVLFAVDLFNEGVDLPEVDTLLLLRPTRSALLFQQQLGRGLRHAEGKECLTVLDFIGQAHQRFSWASLFRVLTGGGAARVESMVAEGFPTLPPGCAVQLDRIARDHVLANIRESTRDSWRWLAEELRRAGGDGSLAHFLRESETPLGELYERPGRSWSALRAEAGFGPAPPRYDRTWRAVARLRHVDDPQLLADWRRVLEAPGREARERPRSALLLAATLLQDRKAEAVDALIARLEADTLLRSELLSLLEALEEGIEHLPIPLPGREGVPLQVHCRYSQAQILAAFGITGKVQAGVRYHEPTDTDLFFVTLQKAEKDYSPRTMYRDFAISPELFHWESQNATGPETPTGRRYQEPRSPERQPLLFLRATKKDASGMTEPYFLAGPLRYLSHRCERPMAITWKLEYPLPGDLFRVARQAAV